MDKRRLVAIGIALQTQVLKACPVHNQLYLDDDENLDRAFALAVELVRRRRAYVEDFNNDIHQLTSLLSSTIGSVPDHCPDCQSRPDHREVEPILTRYSWPGKGGGFAENILESGQIIGLR